MKVVGHVVHAIWEPLFVDSKVAILTSAIGPAIIKDGIIVAYVPQPGTDEDFGSVKKQRFRNIAAKCVPVILFPD